MVVLVALAAAMAHPNVAAAQAPRPVQGSSAAPKPAQPWESPLPVFEFHSGFWINLHHFLYQQARLREMRPVSRDPDAAAPSPAGDLGRPSQLPPDQLRGWTTALDYYAGQLAGRDLQFDGEMVRINDRLAEMENCPNLSGTSSPACYSGLRPELIAALEQAAPAYRARRWPEHDRANRGWVTAVSSQVRQLGAALARQLAAVYHAPWPAGPIRVDVVFYGGPFGAYTTLDSLHITVSSSDTRNQGAAALEIVFHEASHSLAGAVRDAIARECRERNKPIPRDLWHALLFYTTGEIVQRALTTPAGSAPSSAPAYTPYAVRNGLYARQWQGYERLLERFWQPYLDGQTDFETAVARLASAL